MNTMMILSTFGNQRQETQSRILLLPKMVKKVLRFKVPGANEIGPKNLEYLEMHVSVTLLVGRGQNVGYGKPVLRYCKVRWRRVRQ